MLMLLKGREAFVTMKLILPAPNALVICVTMTKKDVEHDALSAMESTALKLEILQTTLTAIQVDVSSE